MSRRTGAIGYPKVAHEVKLTLAAGLTETIDLNWVVISRVEVTVVDGVLDLNIGGDAGGAIPHYRFGPTVLPRSIELPEGSYLFTVRAANGQALQAAMVFSNG